MIGVALLILAIILYVSKKRAFSILLFISFVTNGFNLLDDSLLGGVKNEDLGFLYVIIINIYSYFYEKTKVSTYKKVDRALKIFLIFMIFSILFSVIHYDMSFYELLQGGRQIFYFTSYYFVRKFKPQEVRTVLKFILIITVITSVLYIIMSITGIYLLPNAERFESTDSISFMHRFYDYPPFLELCIILLIFIGKQQKIRNSQLLVAILVIAVICTQGRTLMMVLLGAITIGFLLRKSFTTVFKFFIPLAVFASIFSNVIFARFEKDYSTSDDISGAMQGDFVDLAEGNADSGSSLSFRLAWVAERAIYLEDRPLLENFFGLSLLSDQSPRVQDMYHFYIGNVDRETSKIAQLSTPDIAYGNMLTKFGYGGSFFFFAIWVYIFVIFFKYRNNSTLIFCGMVYILEMICESIAGKGIFNTGNLTVPYLLLAFCQYIQHNKFKNKVQQHDEAQSIYSNSSL